MIGQITTVIINGVETQAMEASKILPGEVAWRSPNGKLYIIMSQHRMKRVARCYNIKALAMKTEEQAKKRQISE